MASTIDLKLREVISGITVHDLGHELAPGQSMNFTYDMHFFGALELGDYRLSVGDLGNRNNIYYAYFKVNADGTYSYD